MLLQDIFFETTQEVSLRPAIRYDGKLYTGRLGDSHLLLYGKLPRGATGDVVHNHPDDIGFVSDRGRYMNRSEAHQYAADYDLLNVHGRSAQMMNTNELTSEMLKAWVPLSQRGRRHTDIHEAAPYSISRTGLGGEHLRIGVWFNAKTGAMLDAYSKNHAELVATEPYEFGITRAEMATVRKHEDFDLDWNESVIKLANAHGWVRVKAEGKAVNLELDLQSSVPADVLKAARHFANELSPTVIFVDYEVQDYDHIWHTRLEGQDMERYLKTGRLPAGS